MSRGRGIDQLRDDANPTALPTNAARQNIVDTEFPGDTANIGSFAPILKARIAGDDEQFGES